MPGEFYDWSNQDVWAVGVWGSGSHAKGVYAVGIWHGSDARRLDAPFDGAGGLRCTANVRGLIAAEIDGSSDAQTSTLQHHAGLAQFDGGGLILAQVTIASKQGAALLAGVGSLKANASNPRISATLNGVGSLKAAATVIVAGGGVGVQAAAQLAGAGTMQVYPFLGDVALEWIVDESNNKPLFYIDLPDADEIPFRNAVVGDVIHIQRATHGGSTWTDYLIKTLTSGDMSGDGISFPLTSIAEVPNGDYDFRLRLERGPITSAWSASVEVIIDAAVVTDEDDVDYARWLSAA